MIQISISRINRNCSISGASLTKKKSRHFAHNVYFALEGIFYFLAFIYLCYGVGMICLVCLLLFLVLLAVRYILFQFFFDGHFKFLTPFRKIQFMLNKDR